MVGHVIFNLLCQMEGVGHVFSNHSKCSGPTVHGGGGGGGGGASVLFDQSKTDQIALNLENCLL